MRISLPCLLLGMALGAPLSAAGQTEAEAPAGAADAATDPLEKIRAGIAAAFEDGDPVPAEVREKLAGFSKRAADQTASPEQAAPNQQDVRKLTAVINEIDGIQKGPANGQSRGDGSDRPTASTALLQGLGHRIKRVCGALQLETPRCSEAANLYAMRWQSGRTDWTRKDAEAAAKSREKSAERDTKFQTRNRERIAKTKDPFGGKGSVGQTDVNAASPPMGTASGKKIGPVSSNFEAGKHLKINTNVPAPAQAASSSRPDGKETAASAKSPNPGLMFEDEDKNKRQLAEKVWNLSGKSLQTKDKSKDPLWADVVSQMESDIVPQYLLKNTPPHMNKQLIFARETIAGCRAFNNCNQVLGGNFTAGEIADVEHFYSAAMISNTFGPAGGRVVGHASNAFYDGLLSPAVKYARAAYSSIQGKGGWGENFSRAWRGNLNDAEQLRTYNTAGTEFGANLPFLQ